MTSTKNGHGRRKRTHFQDPFDFFNDFFQGPIADAIKKELVASRPLVNLIESEESYKFEFAIPGVEKEKVEIQVEDRLLRISAAGKRQLSQGESLRKEEFDFSNFKRTITLPDNADTNRISATVKNGMLIIVIQKHETSGSRNIDID